MNVKLITILRLALVLSGGPLLMFTGCRGMGTKSFAVFPKNQPSAPYEVVTNAINREDWNVLRRLAKEGMRANEYIRNWEKNPVRVGKLIRVGKNFQLDGKPCKTYSFALGFKDGRQNPHWLQVLVQEEDGQSTILDFWEFGW